MWNLIQDPFRRLDSFLFLFGSTKLFNYFALIFLLCDFSAASVDHRIFKLYGQAYMSYKGAIAFCFSLSVHPSFAAKENFSNKNSSRLFAW